MQPFRSLKLVAIAAIATLAVSACSTTGSGANNGANANGAGTNGAYANGLGANGSLNGKNSALQVGHQIYYFDFDNSDVHDSDKPSIQVQANYLATHPNAQVLLEGNTDPRGSREYNIGLGERRAESVADLLKEQGASASQIKVVSYGAEKLASPGDTDDDYALDRRVELSYPSE